MKKTLQEQYLLIKEGKGHKDVFIKEARSLFPNMVRNSATFKEVSNVLKSKQIIKENVVEIGAINQLPAAKKESYELAFEKFLTEEKKKEYFEEEKAELKKVSKQVEDDLSHIYDAKNPDNINNVIFDQVMTGYYAEMKDPKNKDKTVDQLKAIVLKNLAKNPIYYTEKGQFGDLDLGYTVDAPGLGEPKEPKGPHKSSGYGTLKENKKSFSEAKYTPQQKNDIIDAYGKDKTDENMREIIKLIGSGETDKDYVVFRLQSKSGWKGDEKQLTTTMKQIRLENEETQVRTVVKEIIRQELNEMSIHPIKKGDAIMFMGDNMKVLDIDELGNHKLRNKEGKERTFNLSQIEQGTYFPEKDKKVKFAYPKDIKSKGVELNENALKRLQEIENESQTEVLETKAAKIQQEIEVREARINRINEDEDFADLLDKNKIKNLKKEVKILQKAASKVNKMLDKVNKKKAKSSEPKEEIVDEVIDTKPIDDAGDKLGDIKSTIDDIGKSTEEMFEENEEIDHQRLSHENVAKEADEMFQKLTHNGHMTEEDALKKVLSEFPDYMGAEKEFVEQHLEDKYDLGNK
jgi:hypothetical protein